MTRMLSGFNLPIVLGTAILAGVVAFDLAARGRHRARPEPVVSLPEADAERGRQAIVAHGCGACHRIPGIRRATGRVGPSLEDFRHQMFVAGMLPNTPANVADWIDDPLAINPRTAMPDLGVTEEEARDIAAYLFRAP
ncbi:MAG: c-type cytochrome [Planctomycetaceae bacterium]